MEIKRLDLYQKCKIHPEETDIKDVAGCELCFLIKRLGKKGFVAVSVEDLHSILESYKCRTEMLLTIEPRLKDYGLEFYYSMKDKYLSEAKQ